MAKNSAASMFDQEAYESIGESLLTYIPAFETPSADGALFYQLDYLDYVSWLFDNCFPQDYVAIRQKINQDLVNIENAIYDILKSLDYCAGFIADAVEKGTDVMEEAEDKQDLDGGNGDSNPGHSYPGYVPYYTPGLYTRPTATDNSDNDDKREKTEDTVNEPVEKKEEKTIEVKPTVEETKADTTKEGTTTPVVPNPGYDNTGTHNTDDGAYRIPEIKITQTPAESQPQQAANIGADISGDTGNGYSVSGYNYVRPQSEAAAASDTNAADTNAAAEIAEGSTASVVGSTKDLFKSKKTSKTTTTKLPSTSSTTTSSSSSKGFNPIPLAIGLGAAVAGGVGVKMYKDHKNNSEFDDANEDSFTNGNRFWSEDDPNVINSEQNELSSDNLFQEAISSPSYEAMSNGGDSWSMDEAEPATETAPAYDLLGDN